MGVFTRPSNATPSNEPGYNGPSKKTPMFSSRRRQSSIPNAKPLQGPRPLDASANKRYDFITPASTDHVADSFLDRLGSGSRVPQQQNAINGTSTVASRGPYTHQLNINDISRFSLASISQQDTPQEETRDPLDFADFLAPINFDDFHNSITGSDPSLSHFPMPGNGRVNGNSGAQPTEKRNTTQPTLPVPTIRKASGPVTIGRKGSSASTTSGARQSRAESMSTTTTTTSILKGRRQSQFPPNAFNNANTAKAHAPRKSIGPGTFIAPDGSENSVPKRRPSTGGGRKSSAESQKALSVRLASRGDSSGGDNAKTTASPRVSKAKSLLTPSRAAKDLLTPSRTPDHNRSPSGARTPSRTPAGRTTPGRTVTPGGTNRRTSMAHATGLGARTISPTDARRLKRMSIMPPAPPLPQNRISQAPPTPQPEFSQNRPRSSGQSPGPAGRRSMTPSSSRTTPDPNRKSYSSGQSLSSSTSYSSTQNIKAMPGVPNRFSHNGSSSRLPTPKPRLDTNGGNEDSEIVPPVPAIPKAFESPMSEVEQPFFAERSSSLPGIESPISPLPHTTDAMENLHTNEIPSAPITSLGTPQSESAPKHQKQSSNERKKGLQPLRLPPLNLLPLSTPTAAKIKTMKDKEGADNARPLTPPNHRNNAKTPSTPMTASKTSFFSRSHRNNEESQSNVMRSSTSHFAMRSNFDDTQSPASPVVPFGFDADGNQRNISPFISSSLPKNSGEFANYMRPRFSSDLNRTGTQTRPSGPRAPSFSVTTPKSVEQPSPVEPQHESSMSALRRKLSRKRSESKTRSNEEKDKEAAKYDNMPPPKLPASATWGNLAAKSSSPTQPPNYLKSRRKASQSSISGLPTQKESFSSSHSFIPEERRSIESNRSISSLPNRSASLLPSPQAQSHVRVPSHLQGLDHDDMAAEDEMKKLASKRKEFEKDARELDALRKRARPVPRTSPALAQQTHDLNIFERGEIVDYSDVYFSGTRAAKKIVGDLAQASTNFGYDDERGDYNIIEGDHLAYRYEVVDVLGKGSFGQVVRCVDHKTGILVAVKIIRNKKRFHKQALVEVDILKKLREWVSFPNSTALCLLTILQDPNNRHSVVNFDQSFYFRGHLCISTDLLGMNLYEFVKAHDFRGFSLKLIRRFTKQMLSSLVLLHGKKVIHCDLKPENVLLAHPMHSEIKVIDFGSSCFENEKVYTYIQSRFYRSPEVILGMSYGMPIDMWSLGCILAELFTGYPIFPGENEQEQLACIMEVFGPPERHLIEKSSRKKLFFDSMGKPRLTVSSKGRRRRPSSKDLRQVLKCDDEAFLDFIARCLRWDPARRMNPHEANMHEFITGVKLNMNNSSKRITTAQNSPVKRINSVTAPNGARPLPQTPGTMLKPGAARQDSTRSSPVKIPPRRQSTLPINGFQQPTMSTAKRASHAAMNASNPALSRVQMGAGHRSLSDRGRTGSDLAAAAASASLGVR
jgi:dual specificity tyrosine-phosphorylation-regulated kinase 2/3/4